LVRDVGQRHGESLVADAPRRAGRTPVGRPGTDARIRARARVTTRGSAPRQRPPPISFYRVRRPPEAIMSQFAPQPTTADIVRFLEQATWGPTPSLIAHVREIGFDAFLTEQFEAPISSYPSL